MKKCKECNKSVPKRYIEAHQRYHIRKKKEIEEVIRAMHRRIVLE